MQQWASCQIYKIAGCWLCPHRWYYMMSLTHCGRVTQYGDGSMLCKNLIIFTMKNSLKFKMLWFFESRYYYHLLESIAKIAHFIPGGGVGGCGGWGAGGHFDKKYFKKSLFQRLWGEYGHNSFNIWASMTAKTWHYVAQIFLFFLQPW